MSVFAVRLVVLRYRIHVAGHRRKMSTNFNIKVKSLSNAGTNSEPFLWQIDNKLNFSLCLISAGAFHQCQSNRL